MKLRIRESESEREREKKEEGGGGGGGGDRTGACLLFAYLLIFLGPRLSNSGTVQMTKTKFSPAHMHQEFFGCKWHKFNSN